jgi:starvation-inducible DNA-binding protein
MVGGMKMSKELVASVNVQVANLTILYEKLHHYHWFVKGHHFFTLHEKFEGLYNEITSTMDEVAERLLIIGEKPLSTLKACLDTATIKEAAGTERTEQEMVQAVINDFEKMIAEISQTIDLAEKANDEVTGDLFIGISESLGKHVWMLKAFLG